MWGWRGVVGIRFNGEIVILSVETRVYGILYYSQYPKHSVSHFLKPSHCCYSLTQIHKKTRAAKEATERKINLSLPGPFHHILYILQDCYGDDCSWAAYGGVNSWFTVYKGDNYKFPVSN